MPMVSYRCDYDGPYFVQIMDHFIFTLWLHHGPYCHIIITETIKKKQYNLAPLAQSKGGRGK